MKKKIFLLGALIAIMVSAHAQTELGNSLNMNQIDFEPVVPARLPLADDIMLVPESSGTPLKVLQKSLASNAEQVVSDLWSSAASYIVYGDSTYYMDSNTLNLMGSVEQKNYIIVGVDESLSSYACYTEKDNTYTFSGKLTSTGYAEIYPCILYAKNGSYQIMGNTYVDLTESNQFASDFTLSVKNTKSSGEPLALAYLVLNTLPETQITATDHRFTGSYKTLIAKKWSLEKDLPGLGVMSTDTTRAYMAVCEDGVTTLGLYYNWGVLYLTGMNTTATEVTLPEFVRINGTEERIEYFGYNSSNAFDWSGAASVKSLSLYPSRYVYSDFSQSAVEDLFLNNSTTFYNITGADSLYADVNLHLPYTLSRKDYKNYGFKRIFVGDEKPEYPETKVSDWVIPGEVEGEYLGIMLRNNEYWISEIFTTNDSITLPLGTPASGGVYYIRGLGNENYTGSGILTKNAPNLKSVLVPASYNNMSIYWSNTCIENLYMQGDVTASDWYLPSSIKVYVAEPYFWNYYENEVWDEANINPNGWDFDWMTVNVGRKGEFAQTYVEMTNADWNLGVNVKVTGELNETDLANIKNLNHLRKLDLTEAGFTQLPNSFLSDKRDVREVAFPESLTSISERAFYRCSFLEKVTAPGVTKLFREAFYQCVNLKEFDLTNVSAIGSYAFNGCKTYNPSALCHELAELGSYAFCGSGITALNLPQGITELNGSVFRDCDQLIRVTLPEGLKSIGNQAFNDCLKLSEVHLPQGLVSIGSDAFYRCTSLEAIILPDGINTIGSYAFSNCSNLSQINLPEGLHTMGSAVFSNCSQLAEITLPSTLQSIGSSLFYGCTTLATVKSKAIVPPVTNGEFTQDVDLNHCTLYIAPFTIDAYRAADNWNDFYIMKPLNEPVKNIYINRAMTFDLLSEDNAVLQENPNMTLDYDSERSGYYANTVGQLSASGDGTLSAGVFSINHKAYRRSSYNYDKRTTLINNAENMRADSLVTTFNFEKNYWHFISFPYDVKMEDVVGLNGTDFAIRRYNSINRASGDGTTSNWENVPSDGVLEAGKGYIIQVANNSTDSLGYTHQAVVRFPSRNTVTKNRLFSSKDMVVALEEYPAEFAHNRSWNLVGNPYPCYYDIHSLKEDFMTPIVLWRGTNYQAYSPIDDDIVLRPNEAFFVQRPVDTEQMVFGAEGRLHYDAAYETDGTPGIRTAPARLRTVSERSVFNFHLEGNGSDDRARIVLNEEASMEYEINCDASKFFAESPLGAEIYVQDGIKYDICERPFDKGKALLGVRLAQEGTYTLSLTGRSIEGWSVMLRDTQTGTTVDLSKDAYHFEGQSGTENSRFELTFKAPAATSMEDMEFIAGNENVRVVNAAGITVYEGELDNFKTQATAGTYIIIGEDGTYKLVIK